MTDAQNITIEHLATEALIPYAGNARTHSEEQVAQIAASIKEFGFNNPVLVDAENGIIAGHGRVLAARKLGLDKVPCIRLVHLSDMQRRAFILADNKLALNAGWDKDLLLLELDRLEDDGVDLSLVGWEASELDELRIVETEPDAMAEGDADEVPEIDDSGPAVSQRGEVYELGPHRLMCGDSTSAEDVHSLIGDDQPAALMHADPPYGMGKEADGVENDNLYREKLDQFQMDWWRAWRTYLTSNGSAYIWGNAPDLWRLWYSGGLAASEVLTLRNEIVWNKRAIPGMKSPGLTQYPEGSERCLFIQFGNQFLGNINTEDFPDAWEPIRSFMESQAVAANIKPSDIKAVCGCGMYAHWFTRSQFTLIPEKHYKKLGEAYPGLFTRPWKEIHAEWRSVAPAGREVINGKLDGVRSYFDNAHDSMIDVWDFSRVTGEERHGHATPKPVDMIVRCIKSSCPPKGTVLEPFGGSGTTLIAAAKCGRVCRTMEITPKYCDVIRRRWTKFARDNNVEPGTGALE